LDALKAERIIRNITFSEVSNKYLKILKSIYVTYSLELIEDELLPSKKLIFSRRELT